MYSASASAGQRLRDDQTSGAGQLIFRSDDTILNIVNAVLDTIYALPFKSCIYIPFRFYNLCFNADDQIRRSDREGGRVAFYTAAVTAFQRQLYNF